MKKRIICLSMIVMLLMASIIGCSNDGVDNTVNTVIESVDTETVVEETTVEVIEEPTFGDFGGYFWEVKNGDATVYLFGSIHMAEAALFPFNEAVETAFETSDVLGVEADISDTSAVQALAPLMLYENGETIYDHLSPEGIETFEAACAELKLSSEYHGKFKIWVAGSNIMSLQLMKSPYSAKYGVDMYFINKAKALEKEVQALEGIQYQIDLINAFTDEEQENTFFTIGTVQETVDDFKKLYEYYIAGDEEEMTKFLFETDNELTSDDSVENKMLRDRNIGMAEKIDGYLQTDKTYFVVVGLAHYLGDESVVKYLEDKGYTVERK